MIPLHFIVIGALVIIVIIVVVITLLGGYRTRPIAASSDPTRSLLPPSSWLWLKKGDVVATNVTFVDTTVRGTFSDGTVVLTYKDGAFVSGINASGIPIGTAELKSYTLVGAGPTDPVCQTYTFEAPGSELLPTIRESILDTCGSGGPCVKETASEECNDIDQFRAIGAKRRCVGLPGFAGPTDTTHQCLSAKGEWVPSGTLETIYMGCNTSSKTATLSSLFCDGDLNILYLGVRGGTTPAVYFDLSADSTPIVNLAPNIDLTIRTDGFAHQLFRVVPYDYENRKFTYSRHGQFLRLYDRRTKGVLTPTVTEVSGKPNFLEPITGMPVRTYPVPGGQWWINLPNLPVPGTFTYISGMSTVSLSFFQNYLVTQTNLLIANDPLFYDSFSQMMTEMRDAGAVSMGGTLEHYLRAIVSKQTPTDLPTATVDDLLSRYIDFQQRLHDYIIVSVIPPGNMDPLFGPRIIANNWDTHKIVIDNFIPVTKTRLGGLIYVPNPVGVPTTLTKLWEWVDSQGSNLYQVVRNGGTTSVEVFVAVDSVDQSFDSSLLINVWGQISPVILSLP